MRKNDIRLVKTQKAIRLALFRLLDKKPIEKITITELTAKAGICRKTFYLHFHSIGEVLEDFNAEQLKNIEDSIREIPFTDLRSFLVKLAESITSAPLDLDYMRNIAATAQSYRLEFNLVAATADSVAVKLKEALPVAKRGEAERYALFISSTISLIILSWLRQPYAADSLEETAQTAIDLCLNGLHDRF